MPEQVHTEARRQLWERHTFGLSLGMSREPDVVRKLGQPVGRAGLGPTEFLGYPHPKAVESLTAWSRLDVQVHARDRAVLQVGWRQPLAEVLRPTWLALLGPPDESFEPHPHDPDDPGEDAWRLGEQHLLRIHWLPGGRLHSLTCNYQLSADDHVRLLLGEEALTDPELAAKVKAEVVERLLEATKRRYTWREREAGSP